MADNRITEGKAWSGFAGFGVRLKIYGQAPNSEPVLLAETPSHDPSLATFGNGVYAHNTGDPHYLYLTTNGIGTYKLWAEHPDNSNLKAEDTYYFDPDNFQGPGDPFDWRGDGKVPDLIVPVKNFTVSGNLESTEPTNELHLVVALSSPCDVGLPNYLIPLPDNYHGSFSKPFALPTASATTFYVYARDHTCDQSNVETLTNVSGTGETITLQDTLVV